ncbi:hypothetical protein ACO2Q3_02195 [Caulobacter sp. KR2-114]|uniref:hypothetical protein n=1 Tax=Caulobacter sp. KR2-114 TaxID=3400912 RepID=UPI003BFAF78E
MTAPPPSSLPSSQPASPPSSPDGNGAGRFFGVLMIVAGVLIAALSGLCTVVFGLVVAGEAGRGAGGQLAGMVVVMAIFGGIPFAFGVAAILIGRFLYRSSRRPPPPAPSTFD